MPPSGTFGLVLTTQLDLPKQNTSFSELFSWFISCASLRGLALPPLDLDVLTVSHTNQNNVYIALCHAINNSHNESPLGHTKNKSLSERNP